MSKTRTWLAVAATTLLILAVATSTHAVVWQKCCLYSDPYLPCSGCLKTDNPPPRCVLVPDQPWYTCELLGTYYEHCIDMSAVCQDRDVNWWWPNQSGSCSGQCVGDPDGEGHVTVTIPNTCMLPGSDFCR